MSIRCAWIGGWAVPLEYIREAVERAYPSLEHTFYLPCEGTIEDVSNRYFDVVVGYSLGSLLVLNRIEQMSDHTAIVLLAPIFNFQQEAGLGSRVNRTQLKFMQRWLTRDPLAAIQDFYERAGLDIELKGDLPYSIEDLVWGLDVLMNMHASLENAHSCTCVVGEDDALLDSLIFKENLEEGVFVKKGNHDIRSMLDSLSVLLLAPKRRGTD